MLGLYTNIILPLRRFFSISLSPLSILLILQWEFDNFFSSHFLFAFQLFANGVCSIYRIAAVQRQDPSLKIWLDFCTAKVSVEQHRLRGMLKEFKKGVSFFLSLLMGRGRRSFTLHSITCIG